METARRLITALPELSTSMENGKNDFRCRFSRGVHPCRHPTSVVTDRDRIVLMNRHIDLTTEPGERLIDRIVDDLIDEMVKPAMVG